MKLVDALQIKLWQKANLIKNSFINSVLAICKEENVSNNISLDYFNKMALYLLSTCTEEAPLFNCLINNSAKNNLNLCLNSFRYNLSFFEAKARNLLKCIDSDISVIKSIDKNYPRNLLDDGINTIPFLFHLGKKLDINNRIILTIIGSRKTSLYGKRVIENFVRNFKYYPITIVSGFAKGIDSIAHESAIYSNLPTIAILPSSIDKLYPRNYELKSKILENGSFLFEYLPNSSVRKHHFLQRNYLLSRIADLILVVEAGEKSGAMITANYAAEQNKAILSVPGNIDARQSFGSNKLIEEGAKICLNAETLLDEMKSCALDLGLDFQKRIILNVGEDNKKTVITREQQQLPNSYEFKICELLADESLSLEEIFVFFKHNLPLSDLSVLLTKLELEGKIMRNNGRFILTK